jgi:hypothetical protein
MFTCVGYESTTSNPVIAPITPLQDGTVAVIANDIRVPPELPNLMSVATAINSAVTPLRVQITTPSLRSLLPFDVNPIQNGALMGSDFEILPLWATPVPLVGLEPMNSYVQNGASVLCRTLVWLSDGPIKPTTGKIYTVRATATTTLITATWQISSALIFSTTLPTGTYQVVGFRAIGPNLFASRIFFPGYAWRPGTIGQATDSAVTAAYFRYGYMGVFGQFLNTVPPTIESWGATDTAQVFYLDLIKTA